jgi:hypothetical protein
MISVIVESVLRVVTPRWAAYRVVSKRLVSYRLLVQREVAERSLVKLVLAVLPLPVRLASYGVVTEKLVANWVDDGFLVHGIPARGLAIDFRSRRWPPNRRLTKGRRLVSLPGRRIGAYRESLCLGDAIVVRLDNSRRVCHEGCLVGSIVLDTRRFHFVSAIDQAKEARGISIITLGRVLQQ